MAEKRKRTLKNDMYINEQINIKNKLCNILKINHEMNYFYLHDIENDNDMQQQIINLKDEIKKYFLCGQWTCFKDKHVKREYLTIARFIFKNTGSEIVSTCSVIDRNNKKIQTQKYIVINL